MASFVEAQSMLWVYASEKSKIMLTLYMDGPLLLIRYVYLVEVYFYHLGDFYKAKHGSFSLTV